jgi:hypothetical protein
MVAIILAETDEVAKIFVMIFIEREREREREREAVKINYK